jgi:hypothetical protein
MDVLTYGLVYKFGKSYAGAGLLLPIPAKIIHGITVYLKEDSNEIFKYYLILVQLGLLLIRYEWERYVDLFDILFTSWSILFIIQSRDIENEVIHFNIVISVLKSTYYMIYVSKFFYFMSMYFSLVSMLVYIRNSNEKYIVSVSKLLMLPAYYGLLVSVERNSQYLIDE